MCRIIPEFSIQTCHFFLYLPLLGSIIFISSDIGMVLRSFHAPEIVFLNYELCMTYINDIWKYCWYIFLQFSCTFTYCNVLHRNIAKPPKSCFGKKKKVAGPDRMVCTCIQLNLTLKLPITTNVVCFVICL